MFQSRIRPLEQLDANAFHPQYCDCTDCSITRDPIRFRARRRAIVAWALLFSVLAFALYGFALAHAPQIATSFEAGL